MDRMRVAAATLNQTPLDWVGNRNRIIEKINQAQSYEVALLCFPELCISGYSCEDMFFSLHTCRMAEASVSAILPFTKNMAVVLGLPVYLQGAVYNCACFIQDGRVLGINPKKILPREGVHYEARWFEAWQFGRREETVFAGMTVPFGDVRYQFGNVGVGVEICEEAWGSEGAAAAHALAGIEIVVNPSASHFALGKYRTRETLVADASRSMRVHYIYTNLVGLEAGRLIYDGGTIIGECGELTARGRRFGFSDGELTVHDLDLDMARVSKLRSRSVQHLKPEKREGLAVEASDLRRLHAKTPPIPAELRAAGTGVESPEEEFCWAVMLGLFDYMRKTKSKGFVVSLSGGCDSSACATLIAHMMAQALRELGAEALAERLGIAAPESKLDPQAWVQAVLTTVYQATKNSGTVTAEAAKQLATSLGAAFHHINVQENVDLYAREVSQMLDRPLTWEHDDLALQNIQARARAPLVWMLANIKHAILISTSNRSEAAVGYATMDGDTSGGLAPIAGIDKSFLRRWLRWAEHDCQLGLGPLASLSYVNQQAPTAELRPSEASQTDEADLMPYDILTFIEKCYVRDRMDPLSILSAMEHQFADVNEKTALGYLRRFLRLWGRNQWKRERYAPSFHVDDLSLDPKSWCRFPILSGPLEDNLGPEQVAP